MKTHNFTMTGCDTDSISFCKQDGAPFSEEEQEELLKDLNSNFPSGVVWADDGYYPGMVVLKTKNYILKLAVCKKCQNEKIEKCDHPDKIIKKKGSALRSSKTEKAMRNFMDEIISDLLFQDGNNILNIYNKYIKLVHTLTDISDFCSKKTITKSVLSPTRTTEQKILDSLNGRQAQMGDKIYVYFTQDEKLKLAENWTGDEDKTKLMKRIYSTLSIFKSVLPLDQFPKYHLKNKKIQEKLKDLLNTI